MKRETEMHSFSNLKIAKILCLSSSETVATKPKLWLSYIRLCCVRPASDEAGHASASGWDARGLNTGSAADILGNLVQVMMSAGRSASRL